MIRYYNSNQIEIQLQLLFQNIFDVNTNTSDRVAKVIEESGLSNPQIAKRVGVSTTTVWRWRNKKTDNIAERDVEALADVLDINAKWLLLGKGNKYKDTMLNGIESTINNASEDYKGMDRTLSNLESKAENLKQDLQSLIDDIRRISRRDD